MRKIRYFMKIFRFVQSKGARDNLKELGLIRDAIALDVRIQTILHLAGVQVPRGLESNHKLYDEYESFLLNRLCKPLQMTGVEFDRMIYQNYDRIKQIL